MYCERHMPSSVPCSSSTSWTLVASGILFVVNVNNFITTGGSLLDRFKILIWNFKICIISMIKLEPFKGFTHFILTHKHGILRKLSSVGWQGPVIWKPALIISSIGGGKTVYLFALDVQMQQHLQSFCHTLCNMNNTLIVLNPAN